MKWYAAHIILYVKLKDKRQSRYPVWENVVLIEADSETQAFEKAEERGRLDEGDDDGTFRWGGQPATWVFAGVRKLTLCEDMEERPGDGTEITCTELELASKEAVEQLVAGEPVQVRYNDKYRDPNNSETSKRTGTRQKKRA